MFLNPETIKALKEDKEWCIKEIEKIDQKIEGFRTARSLLEMSINRINNMLISNEIMKEMEAKNG